MKRTLLALLALASLPAFGQWTVYDPAVHTQQILSTAQEVAKFVEMIGNQVKQLKVLEDDVATLRNYVDLFGRPGTVRPPAIPGLVMELGRAELGLSLGPLVAHVDGKAAMVYAGGGLYEPVGESFRTPAGTETPRVEALYQPVAVIQDATDNFARVSEDAAARRVALKSEIARTTSALSAATTDAEVQKLTGTLAGLATALQGTDLEVQQASASVLVQDAANRADERRQETAAREAQAAEFAEATEAYRKTFRLMTAPVPFPTR